MITYIYRSYNKLAKYYYNPIIIDANPSEYKEAYRRSVLTERDERKLASIIDFQISCIGTYDDNTGLITTYKEPEYLFDVDVFVKERELNGKEREETNQVGC